MQVARGGGLSVAVTGARLLGLESGRFGLAGAGAQGVPGEFGRVA